MYNILTSNFNTTDSRIIRQLILLNLLTVATATSSAFFALFNTYVTNQPTVASMNVVAFLLALFVFLDLRVNKNLKRASNIAIIGVSLFFSLFVYFNQNNGYGLFWVPFVPIFTIGLVGTQKSLIYLIPYFFVVFLLAYLGIGEWQEGQWNIIGYIRFVFSTLLMTLVVVMMDLALMQSYKNLEKLSSIDGLTNIYNRRKIQEIAESEILRAKRHNRDLGVVLFDIDNFKNINDKHGHQGGDKVLKNLTKKVQEVLRNSDSFGRWGGEEFLIILPEVSKDNIKQIAEKIRLLIWEINCTVVNDLSCSLGVTVLHKDEDTIDSFIDRADNAMYKAKEMGKNRVEIL